MRFLIDESTGAAVVRELRDAGHDVVAVADAMPQYDPGHIGLLTYKGSASSLAKLSGVSVRLSNSSENRPTRLLNLVGLFSLVA